MSTPAEPKTAVITGGRKRITSTLPDGTEVMEEYDVITDELLLRKTRTRTTFGELGPWVVEVGKEPRAATFNKEFIIESGGTPELVRQDTKDNYVFRIRNLPYPREVFALSVERQAGDDIGHIVVRTSNRKYFKKVFIPDMQRAQVPLEETALSFDVKHNTLVIQYRKPLAVLTAEALAKKERAALPAKRIDSNTEGCAPQ